MPAPVTPRSSREFTDWKTSPSGFVAQGWAGARIDLSPLSSPARGLLETLATDRGETVGDTIRAICDFLVSNDHEDDTTLDAVNFYLRNYHGVAVG